MMHPAWAPSQSRGFPWLLQLHGFGAPVVDPVEHELEGAVRLGTECDLRSVEKEPPLSDGGVDDGNAMLEITLAPRPAAAQRALPEPGHGPHVGDRRPGLKPEHRAVVVEDVDGFRQPVSERVARVDARLED